MELEFWNIYFVFQFIIVVLGLISHLIFMRIFVFNGAINLTIFARTYLFIISAGYQIMLLSFTGTTVVCLTYGSMFEEEPCLTARIPYRMIHNYGEFSVVYFHFLINFERLYKMIYPLFSLNLTTMKLRLLFVSSIVFGVYASIVYLYLVLLAANWVYIAVFFIFIGNMVNLCLEIYMFELSEKVFTETRGVIPLENRAELSTSVKMSRCFLPSSVASIMFKFVIIVMFLIAKLNAIDSKYLPPYFFLLNTVWNLDCLCFPWFMMMFQPQVREKIVKFFTFGEPSISPYDGANVQSQEGHFEQLNSSWKI